MSEPATFPQTLYVEIMNPEGDMYYCASADLNERAEINKKIKVGVYQLLELHELEFQVVSTKVEG